MWISTLMDRREAGILGEAPHNGDDDNQLRGTCPLCRRAVGNVNVEVQGQAISTPPPEPAAELEVPDTPESFASILSALESYAVEGQSPREIDQFPVWVSIKGQEALLDAEFVALETATSLRSGALSMIVDPGARTNLLGSEIARRLVKRALETGHRPEQGKLKNPLTIQGVGNGCQECKWEINCPIVVPLRGGSAKLHNLRSPMVEGTGSHLPGLLGLETLEAQGAILDMGRKMLIFPGSGDVKI